MRILFTGASSFTGSWFVRELAAAGHDVHATFRRGPDEYLDAVRRERVRLAVEVCRPIHGVGFGDERFLGVVREGGWDLIAHHAAEVTNYKSPDFDVAGALRANTLNLAAVLGAARAGGCSRVVLTGSVFEGGEGSGSEGLPHVSAYGLSKALTAETFRFYCARAGFHLGKFVVPNPFGPWEEARYTAHLVTSWLRREKPACASPAYVRDNIHVSLLAKAYARFAAAIPAEPGFSVLRPSGYVEAQGAFTMRVAAEMRPRLGLPCDVELRHQDAFPEPRVRINTDALDARSLGWDESAAWDAMARYYVDRAGA